jgi:hypothetical protein
MQENTFDKLKQYIREWAKNEPYCVELGENLENAIFELDDIDSCCDKNGNCTLWGTLNINFKSGALLAEEQKRELYMQELQKAQEQIKMKYYGK